MTTPDVIITRFTDNPLFVMQEDAFFPDTGRTETLFLSEVLTTPRRQVAWFEKVRKFFRGDGPVVDEVAEHELKHAKAAKGAVRFGFSMKDREDGGIGFGWRTEVVGRRSLQQRIQIAKAPGNGMSDDDKDKLEILGHEAFERSSRRRRK